MPEFTHYSQGFGAGPIMRELGPLSVRSLIDGNGQGQSGGVEMDSKERETVQ